MRKQHASALRAAFASLVTALALSALCAVPALATPGNEDMSTATSIVCNRDYSFQTTENWGDEDWYKFTISKPGTVQVAFTVNGLHTSGGWGVILRDSNNNELDRQSFNANSEKNYLAKTGLPAGTYYVQVDPGLAEGYRYTIRVDYAAASNWETEKNNGLETADAISTNTTVYGSTIANWNDEDYFRFSISKPGTLQLVFNNDQHTSGSWTGSIIDSSGKTLDATTFDAISSSGSGIKVGVPAGTYYVKIEPAVTYGYLYNFRVNYTAASNWETEFNDDFGTADPLAFGAVINGSTRANWNDVDFFRVEVKSATSAQLYFSNAVQSSGEWTVKLLNAKGEELDELECEANIAAHEGEKVSLSPGTYYIKVEPAVTYGFTYSVKLGTPGSSSSASGDNPQQSPQTQTMYRLYNPYTGEHFYTANAGERDTLRSIGWTYEGVGWVAPLEGDPVYRLFNPYTDDHHYTTSAGERDALKSIGWRYEGVGWRSGGSVPVLRQFNPYVRTATHNYTVSREENDKLVSIGWRAEGTGWYAVSAK